MEKTNQELKDELLIAYRLHFSALYERDRLRDRLAVSKRKLKEAEKDVDNELENSKDLRKRNRFLDEENDRLVVAAYNHQDVVDAALELIGEVVIHEVKMDALVAEATLGVFGRTEDPGPLAVHVASRVTVPMWFMPVREDGGPARCLSCGDAKVSGENFFFLCEDCYDLDIENDLGLFGPMMDAWNKGERDFPRPGKNAKELSANEGSGER